MSETNEISTEVAAPKPKKPKKKMQDGFMAVGRRKTAIARVHMIKGDGKILINGMPYQEYVSNRHCLMTEIEKPFKIANIAGVYRVLVKTSGGGIPGQADAVKLGIARALVMMDPALKGMLGKAGCLVRDSRAKERKKYGQKKARKRFQYSKR